MDIAIRKILLLFHHLTAVFDARVYDQDLKTPTLKQYLLSIDIGEMFLTLHGPRPYAKTPSTEYIKPSISLSKQQQTAEQSSTSIQLLIW